MIFPKTTGNTVPNPFQSAMTEKTIRREFLKTALAAMAGAGGVGVLTSGSCNRQSEIRNPTREELIKRLEKLAASEPPKNLSLGAMCYRRSCPEIIGATSNTA